jgi:hypothetical protein
MLLRSHKEAAMPELELLLRIGPDVAQRVQLAHLAGLGSTLEDTAVALLARGFDAERSRIRQYLETAVGPA